MNNLKKLSIIAASLLLIFLLLNSAQATGAQILGCVAKEGVLRIIGMGSRKEKCNKNETLISWNSEGQIGLEGPQGPKGDTGANGENATELHLYDTNNQDLSSMALKKRSKNRRSHNGFQKEFIGFGFINIFNNRYGFCFRCC
ncbi:hypothetical protein HYT00_03440 [Candidatus Giovannonibacteria bacterium]|nr:hypothetical protein [Candidatus Giovannonibacteria bacterium]